MRLILSYCCLIAFLGLSAPLIAQNTLPAMKLPFVRAAEDTISRTANLEPFIAKMKARKNLIIIFSLKF